jgi:uncharacterized membrane protein
MDASLRPPVLVTLGRSCFGLALLGFAAEHCVTLDFASRVVLVWPGVNRELGAILAGAMLAAGGVAALAGRGLRPAGALLAALFGGGFLMTGLPKALAHWQVGGAWTPACKILVFVGGAVLLGASAQAATARRAWIFCRFMFALFVTLGGVQHFVYATFVQTLIPRYFPAPLFWTYAAGGALIAVGIGLSFERTARPAALAAGAMIFSWFLILHIPRAVEAWTDRGEWSGVAESLGMAGIAWLIAGIGAGLSRQPIPLEET